MNTQELFTIVAERMRTDLKATRAALKHPGLRGASFEDSFRGFLRSYLPRALDVSTGVLIDSKGNHSRQLDVIVSDALRTPVLYSVGETRVIPIECAYMVMEIKAHLNAAEVAGCLRNMESVRALVKDAYVRPAGPIMDGFFAYGREWEIYPTNYLVFAFDAMDIGEIAKTLVSYYQTQNSPLERRVDTICVLDKGVVTNQLLGGKFDLLPDTGSTQFVCRTEDALLLFYSLLSRYVNQLKMPPFRFTDYLGQMNFGVSSAPQVEERDV